jgi:hypothetical protein
MKVWIVIPYRVSHLQRYGVIVRGNVTSLYPPLQICPHILTVRTVLHRMRLIYTAPVSALSWVHPAYFCLSPGTKTTNQSQQLSYDSALSEKVFISYA